MYVLFIIGRKCQFNPEKDHKDPDITSEDFSFSFHHNFHYLRRYPTIPILTKSNIYKTKRTHQTNMSTEDRKVALITGITGQDGSYLTELLLEKGYTVRSHAGSQLI